MQHKYTVLIIGLLSLTIPIFTAGIVAAQEEAAALPNPQTIEIAAADEQILVGDFYATPDVQAPTILLLHELNASRASWVDSIEVLWQAGYNTLAVDLRGHGDTGGEQNWEAALVDVETWLDWLQEQPEVQKTGVSIIGANLGANLSVIACEYHDMCVTAVALSPIAIGCDERDCSVEAEGLDDAAIVFLDAASQSSLTNPDRSTPALTIYGQNDEVSKASVIHIARDRADVVELGIVFGNAQGVEVFTNAQGQVQVIEWLGARIPPNLSDEEIETMVAAADPENGATLFEEGIVGAPPQQGRACRQCHLADSEEKHLGPGLLNIGERAGFRVDGQSAAVYLYHSIVAPERYLVEEFSGGMPSEYDRGFTEVEIADLVAYLLTLEAD